MNPPLVSIGIFVYNEAKYISETIESMLNQSYTNLEIVISDNCSYDGTSSIIAGFADNDLRIKFHQQKTNIGAFENLRYVFENSTGEYFMWMGGHDVIAPTLIEQALSAFQKNGKAILVYPNSEFIDGKSQKTGKSSNAEIDNVGLTSFERIEKSTKNIKYCTPIYGLFKKSELKKVPIIKIVGSDNLMLFYAAYLGEIIQLRDILYYRREVRREDSLQERLDRYRMQGVSNFYNYHPNYALIYQHFKCIISMRGLSVIDKWKLVNIVWHKYPIAISVKKTIKQYVK